MVNADKVARRIAAVGLELRHQMATDAMTDECRDHMQRAAESLFAAFQHVEAAIRSAEVALGSPPAGLSVGGMPDGGRPPEGRTAHV